MRAPVWTECIGGGPLDGRKVGIGHARIAFRISDEHGCREHLYDLNGQREYEYIGCIVLSKAHD